MGNKVLELTNKQFIEFVDDFLRVASFTSKGEFRNSNFRGIELEKSWCKVLAWIDLRYVEKLKEEEIGDYKYFDSFGKNRIKYLKPELKNKSLLHKTYGEDYIEEVLYPVMSIYYSYVDNSISKIKKMLKIIYNIKIVREKSKKEFLVDYISKEGFEKIAIDFIKYPEDTRLDIVHYYKGHNIVQNLYKGDIVIDNKDNKYIVYNVGDREYKQYILIKDKKVDVNNYIIKKKIVYFYVT